MMWPIEMVSVGDLRLDLKNARIREETPKEEAALNYLYAADDVMDLAHSFLRDGYIDNEVPVVVANGRAYAVLEGNRRVAALKGLADPSSVPTRTRQLERLVKQFPNAAIPDVIRVMVAPSRAAAQPLLARLHIGLNKKGWDRDQQAVFFHAQLGPDTTLSDLKNEYPAESSKIRRFIVMGEVLELVRRVDLDDATLTEFVHSRRFKISSFEYVYKKPGIRALAGLEHDADGMLVKPDLSPGALRVVRRLIRDSESGKLSTRSAILKTDTDPYKEYLAELAALAGSDAPPPQTSGASGKPGTERETSGASGGDADSTGKGGGLRGRSKAKRGDAASYLNLAGVGYAGKSAGLRRRFEELADIDVHSLPNAAGDHLRSVLECTIKHYFRGLNDPLPPLSHLGDCIAKTRKHFATNRRMTTIINALDQPGQTSTQFSKSAWMLNAINHEPDVFVEGPGVHAAWEHMAPLIKELLAAPTTK